MARVAVIVNLRSWDTETLYWAPHMADSLDLQQPCRWVASAMMYGLRVEMTSPRLAVQPEWWICLLSKPMLFSISRHCGCSKEGSARVQKSLLLQVTSALVQKPSSGNLTTAGASLRGAVTSFLGCPPGQATWWRPG